jgi:hypothetical protein
LIFNSRWRRLLKAFTTSVLRFNFWFIFPNFRHFHLIQFNFWFPIWVFKKIFYFLFSFRVLIFHMVLKKKNKNCLQCQYIVVSEAVTNNFPNLLLYNFPNFPLSSKKQLLMWVTKLVVASAFSTNWRMWVKEMIRMRVKECVSDNNKMFSRVTTDATIKCS